MSELSCGHDADDHLFGEQHHGCEVYQEAAWEARYIAPNEYEITVDND